MSAFVEALVAEIADLEDQMASDQRYQKLRELKRVRNLYVNEVGPLGDRPTSAAGSRPFASGVSAEVMKAAKKVLSGAGAPTPTRIIMQKLAARGVFVGGSQPQNSLSAILSKSGAFQSHGRSGWTLVNGHDTEKAGDESFPEAASPAVVEHRTDHPVEPRTQGREAVPWGGT